MKKICYSFLLTIVVALVGLQLAGWRGDAPLRQIEGEDLFTGEVQASVDSISLATTETGDRSWNWRSVVAGEETGLTKPDKGSVADPVGAFQRWAREFMDGTADL
ncbi:uncharacterized protein METZ01_LOCUS331790, partial [marine metagenome]